MNRIDISEAMANAWRVFTRNLTPLVIGMLISGVVTLISLGLLFGVMSAGFYVIVRKSFAGQEASVGDVFAGFQDFWRYFWGGWLAALLGVAGLFMCCVGVFLTAPIIQFMYALLVHGCGPTEAVSLSWSKFKTHTGGFFALFFLCYALNVVGGFVPLAAFFTAPLGVCLTYAGYVQLFGVGDPHLPPAVLIPTVAEAPQYPSSTSSPE
ncbi:MAG: hypothetical protein P9L99_08815 [Candidatus Lernaella stagnicola]|nr:hypothetical protein [Candidatus Lernaella stagnicola]